MANISFKILLAHWIAFLDVLQQFFRNYTPRPLLSTVLPGLVEDGSKFSPIVHVPRLFDPPDYINPVNLATMCLVPTPLATNLSYNIDPSDSDLGGSCILESLHYYVLLDTPGLPTDAPLEDIPPTSSSEHAAGDDAQYNMAPYGARGLSFCPVLVGVVYIQSLVYLYVFLMIPTIVNHWFEDVLIYESINPGELVNFSWFLHTSLWATTCHLLPYGIHRAVIHIYRNFRRVRCKSVHPTATVPHILLIRVDEEAALANLVEDHQTNANVGVWLSLDSVDLEIPGIRDEKVSVGGESRDFMQSLVSDGNNCAATESEVLSMQTTSPDQAGDLDQITESEVNNDIELGPPTSEFAEGHQPLLNQISCGQEGISPVLVEDASKLLQSVKEKNLDLQISAPKADIATPSECNFDERTDGFEQIPSPGAVVDDDPQDGTGNLKEREDSDRDAAFSPWSLISGYGADDSDTPSPTMSTTSSSEELQIIPIKNVRFTTGDDADAVDCGQAPTSDYRADEYSYAWDLGYQFAGDNVTSVQVPVVPFHPLVEKPHATFKQGQTTDPDPPVLEASDKGAEDNDAILAGSLSPFLAWEPIVNLPSVVIIREDLEFAEMGSKVLAAPAENIDIVTRSPFQMFSPIASTVVINMTYGVEVEEREEQGLTSLGAEGLNRELPHAGHAFNWLDTLDGNAATYKTVDTPSLREDGSYPRSPSPKGSNLVRSSTVDCEPSLGDLQTPEITLTAPAADSEMGVPVVNTGFVFTNTSPGDAKETSGMNTPEDEILYETPRYVYARTDFARSLRDELQGPQENAPDATNTGLHLPAFSESHKEPGIKDRINFAAAEKSDGMPTTLGDQPIYLSGTFAADLWTAKPSERQSVFPDTCNGSDLLSTVSTKRTGKLDHGKSREAYAIPWNQNATLTGSPKRTLLGSIHAPSILRTNNDTDQSSVLYETPPFTARPVLLTTPNEGKSDPSTIIENASERKKDLSASIHAPQRISKPEVQTPTSQLRDERKPDRQRSLTSPIVVSEGTTTTKPSPPNWTAMPEVVDAFRMFKKASSGNVIRRVSSIAECTTRRPKLGIVGQKGFATNSLNNTSAMATIQSHWMHGSGLLLIRDLVSSDPADFNLRTCTNLKVSKARGTNASPIQPVLYPGMLDISPYTLPHGAAPRSVQVDADFGTIDGGSTGIQRQQSMLIPHKAEIEPFPGSQCWMAYRG